MIEEPDDQLESTLRIAPFECRFGIYTHDEAIVEFDYESRPEVDIVVTQQIGDQRAIIAELSDVRRIFISGGGDRLGAVLFNAASLANFSGLAITVEGDTAAPSVHGSLSSASRVRLETSRGDSLIVGILQSQDIVTLSSGTTIADYEVIIDDDTHQLTLMGEETSISFSTSNGLPQFASRNLWPHDETDPSDDEFRAWLDRFWEDGSHDLLPCNADNPDPSSDEESINARDGLVQAGDRTDVSFGFDSVFTSGLGLVKAMSTSDGSNGGFLNDYLSFHPASSGHCETIFGFEPGDMIDFAATDASRTAMCSQRLSLGAGSALTASGQAVTHDLRRGSEFASAPDNILDALHVEDDHNGVEPPPASTD